ncbi:hypothetical protein Q5H93_20460 [Hymenobacter sp. ASUV-10]|uniref:Uncharacterized protein n=1 Tax=Hymenobacter aranciens TaxID=3063996 RepID=A0ABT9BFT0_9BACT|nr:hypothetical protein [Hymenobacter sp. ASUV-10]MDO7877130.1 hypothetical protein [Hymenobacter sp. ASUV-10]
MASLLAQFEHLLTQLATNPRIELLEEKFSYVPNPALELADAAAFQLSKYGFVVPEAGWELFFSMYGEGMDIAWVSHPDPSHPALADPLVGSLNMVTIGMSVSHRKYRLQMDVPEPGAEHASYFDNSGHQDTVLPTMLLYDRAQRQLLGLYAFLRPELVKLDLDLAQYAAAALAWHGAYGWQLLYCDLEEFEGLPLYLRREVYRLKDALPRLFPDADWSIIEAKRAYFDTELAA